MGQQPRRPFAPGRRRCLPARRVSAPSLQRARRRRGQRVEDGGGKAGGGESQSRRRKSRRRRRTLDPAGGGGSWREEEDLRRGGGERTGEAGRRRRRRGGAGPWAGRAVGGAYGGSRPLRREPRRERPQLAPPPGSAPAAMPAAPPRQLASRRRLARRKTWRCKAAALPAIALNTKVFLTPLRPSRPGTPGRKGLARWTLEPTAVGATPPFLWFLQRSVVPSIYFKGNFNNDYKDDFCPLFQFKRKNKLRDEGV